MSAPKPLSARLAELDALVASGAAHIREVQRQQQQAKANAERAREAVVEAFAAGDEAKAGKLHEQRLQAEAEAAGPWAERIAGAQRAGQRADADRVEFATTEFTGLLAEREPVARAATKAVEEALEALRAAHKCWHGVEAEVAGLMRLAGHEPGTLARFPSELEDLVHDARRAAGATIPAPLPRALQSMSIPPMHDPDPEIREAARAKITAGKARVS